MEKKMSASLSIARGSDGRFRIYVQDNKSRARFLQLELTAEQFANALTGLVIDDAEMFVKNLDVVGKTKVVEHRQARPYFESDRKDYQEFLTECCKEPGWEINTYLGSQGSITHGEDGNVVLNYSVFKYVD